MEARKGGMERREREREREKFETLTKLYGHQAAGSRSGRAHGATPETPGAAQGSGSEPVQPDIIPAVRDSASRSS
ncbi:hypothetical protein EYF80_006177 [Liparis tanakae]|uniref:Uncharacterized protein n=1 Tax=Liparis tanakae TaxID=230148 RepID=A0A4Z2J0C0_9TELE|nr:hypothetical protein EYF80_006177 [Liparis tanakae]